MRSDKVFVRDLIQVIKRYSFRITVICLIFTAAAVYITRFIEKKYVASFEINVYSKYFQNPLISEVIPDVYNVPEMRYTIDSMVKEAISDEYLDSLGETYKIYSTTKDDREQALERQLLRDRFSYFSTGGQSYQVTFTHSDPYVAKEIAQKTLKVVKENIISSRIDTIELVREVMVKKLNSFNASQKLIQKESDKALASRSPDVLKEELAKVMTSIAALSKQFKESHPKIKELRQREAVIIQWLQEFDMKPVTQESTDLPIDMNHDKIIANQLSSKFYTKYHNFNIALEIEKQAIAGYIATIRSPQLPTYPTWPRKRIFAGLGLIVGMILSFIYVYIAEALVPNDSELLSEEATQYGTTVLGSMPYQKMKKQRSPVWQETVVRSSVKGIS